MLKLAVAGLGKMGLSHQSIVNAHPGVKLVAVCDSSAYVLDVLKKYTGVETYSDYATMLDKVELDAIVIATPTRLHGEMVLAALHKGLHVFCEKPFCLTVEEGARAVELARERGVVTQVGYHYRFVGAFQEVERLLAQQAIGRVTHVLAEAYGPVVLRPQGSTWRTRRSEGGGCLYDYAAHPLNLLNWYFGKPESAAGCVMRKIFSEDTEDEVVGTLKFRDDVSAQLSVNWSDESFRKMGTSLRITGTGGRIFVDRQECHLYLRESTNIPEGYQQGWNVRYTTDLTESVWFYLRGEEYSAQLNYFVRCIEQEQRQSNVNSFGESLVTDQSIDLIIRDAREGQFTAMERVNRPSPRPRRRWFRWWS